MSQSLTVREITDHLESIAPLAFQESYDNCGLLTGSHAAKISKVMISLDCTEAVLEEAIQSGCKLLITHHPLIFRGIKKITGSSELERCLIKAIKKDISIYAIHTNLDNVFPGVNHKICEKLSLKELQILDPKKGLFKKIIVFVPQSHLEKTRKAMFDAGAGHIGNYDECSFSSEGNGTFRGNEESKPFVGKKGKRHNEPEHRLEMIFPGNLEDRIIKALVNEHPYEEPAFDIFPLDNSFRNVGAGMIGKLPKAMKADEFLKHLRKTMKTGPIRYTSYDRTIEKVAVCGGAGSFLLPIAISAGAQAFVTSDFKYHEFFEASSRLMIADIGHYESEIFTRDLIRDLILEKFPNFAVLLSESITNPIKYY